MMTEKLLQQLLLQIREAGKKRDYEAAIRLCTELLSQTDQYPEAILYLGRSYHALKRYDKALHAFQFFLDRKPAAPLGYFFLGRTYAALGLHKKAIAALKIVLEKDPHFVPALSFIGVAYLKLRRPEIALPFFEQALKADPKNIRIRNAYLNALLVQGIRLFYRKDLEGAARVFEFLAKEQRGNILPVIYLAIISRELGNYTLSLLYYDEALKISPHDPVFHLHKAHILLKIGRQKEGLSELKYAKEFLKEDIAGISDPAQLLRLIAVTHYKNNRYREAIYFGKQVLKNNYADADMHMLLAECYRFFGDLVKAKNHYTRALEADSRRSELLYGLAVVLWERGDFQELAALARRIQRLNPNDPMASYFQVLALGELKTSPETLLQDEIHRHGPDPQLMWSLAREYVRNGRPELAENWLVRTLKLIPGDQESLLLLDQVYANLKRYTDEILVLKEYCGRFPAETYYLKKYVRLLLFEARYAEAVNGLEKLITREPGNIRHRRTLGIVLLKAGNYSDALIIFKELITREPKSVFYLRQLIYCLVKLKKLATAVSILEKASRFMKNETAILLPLGVLYGRTKQFEKAGEIFRAVLGIDAGDWRAYHNLSMLAKRMGNRALSKSFLRKAQGLQSKPTAVKMKEREKSGKNKKR
jgi:tetratricopeptide (TPR) repeat protein